MMSMPRYAIIGSGRWGGRMALLLQERGNSAELVKLPYRDQSKSEIAKSRAIIEALEQAVSTVDIVWLALPPGEHQTLLAEAALSLGKNVIVEKPWRLSSEEADRFTTMIIERGLQIGIHFQYCFLDRLVELSRDSNAGDACTFNGTFTISGPDRLAIPPVYNLGSHIVAIWLRHFPKSRLSNVTASYDSLDSREIALVSDTENKRYSFLSSDEPIIQRFLTDFEKSIRDNSVFSLGPQFCRNVNEAIETMTQQ